jgi:structural maintenance of chromosome 1
LILHRALYKLYHIEESLKDHANEIKKQNRALVGLREEQQSKQEDLDGARSEQAKSKTKVSREERRLKKAEKALEGKVRLSLCFFFFHYMMFKGWNDERRNRN